MYKMLPQKIEKGLTEINGYLVNFYQNILDKRSSLFSLKLGSHFYDLDNLTCGFALANLIAMPKAVCQSYQLC